ncbi:MAG: hypothetical protein U0271_43870 [Polyangiaceae bacterium]
MKTTCTWRRAAAALASSALAAGAIGGCGEACPDLGGTWTISSHCEPSFVGQEVNITADACELEMQAPFDGWTGEVSDDGELTVTGVVGGDTFTCTGTATDSAITMSCFSGTCAVTLTR